MKKLFFVLLLFLLTSCSGIQQKVSYDYDKYEIQTWNNWYKYNAIIYTTDVNLLDSLKKVEIIRAEKSIQKLKELNNSWL